MKEGWNRMNLDEVRRSMTKYDEVRCFGWSMISHGEVGGFGWIQDELVWSKMNLDDFG